MSTATPATNIFFGVTGELEPMLLLDTTGSMHYQISATDQTERHSLLQEAMKIVVAELEKRDAQSGKLKPGDDFGLRTVTFAGGTAFDIGDLNSGNIASKWSHIRWGGGTEIMPGLQKLLEVYQDEFGGQDASARPTLLALVVTDGEADDTAAFASAMSKVAGSLYVGLAIIGYGDEHDAALRKYESVADVNRHVKVISLAAETDPHTIARTLLRMVE